MAGYLGNAKLREADDEIEYTPELQKEFVKCMEDIIYFAEKYCHIVTIDEGRVKIKLWDFQRKMLKVMHNPPEYMEKSKRHVIMLLPRQSGKCLQYDSKIKIRNKKTGEIKELSIGDFHALIKNKKQTN